MRRNLVTLRLITSFRVRIRHGSYHIVDTRTRSGVLHCIGFRSHHRLFKLTQKCTRFLVSSHNQLLPRLMPMCTHARQLEIMQHGQDAQRIAQCGKISESKCLADALKRAIATTRLEQLNKPSITHTRRNTPDKDRRRCLA